MHEQVHTTATATTRFEDLPPVSFIESDRFCRECGYNLRTQAIRRDPRTRLLLARCPECHLYHPAEEGTSAGRLWLRRLATLLLLAWIALVAGGIVGLLSAQGGISFATLDELTHGGMVTTTQPGPAGTITTMRWYRSHLKVRQEYEHYHLFLAAMGSASAACAFLTAMLVVVVFHHWPRWAYWPTVLAAPVLVAMFVWLAWRGEAQHLLAWGRPYILGHASVQMLGGAVGVVAGRPLARGIVRVFLPPRARPVLAFLWLVDGKQPPGTTSAGSDRPGRV